MRVMIESEVIALVSNVGFPIAVTLWFMFRTERVINANTDATRRMIELIEKK